MRFLLVSTIAIAACAPGAAAPNQASEAPAVNSQTAIVVANATANTSVNASAAQAGGAALTGTRSERIAQLLLNSLKIGSSRDWVAAQAAFPGARWQRRTSDTAQAATINGQTFPTAQSVTGSTDVIIGTIMLGRARYNIVINGSQSRIHAISFDSPDVDDRAAIRQAFEARGGQWRSEGCIGGLMEIVRLSHDGASLLVDFSTNMGTQVEPTSFYTLEFETPPSTSDLDRCQPME